MRGSAWIFGYGSLVWRPAFPYRERRPAYVHGWARRFWQGSTDHRGVPGAPGRVVTLVPEAQAVCWGAAYEVEPARAAEVLERLDDRERGGYERHEVTLHFPRENDLSKQGSGLVYLATPENHNYLGPAPLQAIAAQIRSSVGPSGANIEYVMRLAESLREMSADDEHVFALERLLQGMID